MPAYTPLLLSAALLLAASNTYAQDNVQPEPVRIVFLGNSITEAGAKPGGYVSLVADSLGELYPEHTMDVIGAGISGNKVPDLQARLEQDVLAQKPTHVVIYIGINDVWHHYQFEKTTGTPPDVYEKGLLDLVATIQETGATVLLCTPSVIGEDTESDMPVNSQLVRYAEISRTVATTSGAHLCDLRIAFEEYLLTHNTGKAHEGILTTDGVHLNEAGNRFVASFMLQNLRAVLDL